MLYHTTVSVCIPILFCTIDKSEIFCPGLISLNFSHSFVTYCYFCLIETTFHSFGHLYGCYFLTSGSLVFGVEVYIVKFFERTLKCK